MERETTTRQTCVKLEINEKEAIFVRGAWTHSLFRLAITDGLHAWLCHRTTEEEVRERAAQWEQGVSEYIELVEKHLAFQHPSSLYRFTRDAAPDDVTPAPTHKRLSWTFEKEGTKLEWQWKCQPSPDSKKTTAEILDFLVDANIRLSEEVVSKNLAFSRLKEEAEKCLAQSEKFCSEKIEFESAIYEKFLVVLNSKKQKLRELRDQLSKRNTHGKQLEEEEESTDKMESFDEGSDEEKGEEEVPEKLVGPSKAVPKGKSRSRKRV